MDDIICWHELFMGAAVLVSKRSKDPNTKVGATVVSPDNRVVGLGYNGFPRGCEDTSFPWSRKGEGSILNTKYPFVVHAEVNAIHNSIIKPLGCTVYSTLFPCHECAKFIIQSGITRVYYLKDKYHNSDSAEAARMLFSTTGVAYSQLKFDKTITIDLVGEDEILSR